MGAFFYGVILQWKLDFRNKGVLLTYYIVPLVFFAFMGSIFASITPESKDTLIQSMTVFGVTMGAILGAPIPLAELYGSEIKKAYKVGQIPLGIPAINNFLSALIHLLIMSSILFCIAPLAFKAKIPSNGLVYWISLLIFIVVSLGVGTVLGVWIKNTSKLTMVSQFIFLPSLMLSGIMFPREMLPQALRGVGEIFPATWGFRLLNSEVMAWKFVAPLLASLIVTLCISAYLLLKCEKE